MDQARLEVLYPWRLSFATDFEALRLQVTRLALNAAGKFRIEASVIFDHPPLRSDALAAIRAIFFSGDAQKDSCCQWAGDVNRNLLSEPAAQVADSDELTVAKFADQLIDQQRRRNQHRVSAEPRHLRWHLHNLWF